MSLKLTLITREGCHLCAEAAPIVAQEAAARGLSVAVRDVDADPDLLARYDWEVPVVLIGGRQHSFHRVDRRRLAAALDRAMAARGAPDQPGPPGTAGH
ncbi:glutaredoxin family protein [Brevibacterium sp. BRM-1]|uniref:glutaredoxin family protein n=1 Tax=Brevibacterium sp. BRM-1 TaxID=2999062 RepID=UPI00227E50F5|nr:glutaredoxin family protein [Brevibacterium sp. BRM-1]WAL39066.1 glutaredoxin family protein [Brevibacterium sp. BRM-1]